MRGDSRGQALHRGENEVQVGIGLAPFPGETADAGIRPYLAKRLYSLVQNLLTVSNKEYSAELGTIAVERSKPGLAETGGEDDKPGGEAFLSRPDKRCQCLPLDSGFGRGGS